MMFRLSQCSLAAGDEGKDESGNGQIWADCLSEVSVTCHSREPDQVGRARSFWWHACVLARVHPPLLMLTDAMSLYHSHLYSCVSGASDTRHTETGDGDKGRKDGKRRLKGESIN
jgi:hypothetical protein